MLVTSFKVFSASSRKSLEKSGNSVRNHVFLFSDVWSLILRSMKTRTITSSSRSVQMVSRSKENLNSRDKWISAPSDFNPLWLTCLTPAWSKIGMKGQLYLCYLTLSVGTLWNRMVSCSGRLPRILTFRKWKNSFCCCDS